MNLDLQVEVNYPMILELAESAAVKRQYVLVFLH